MSDSTPRVVMRVARFLRDSGMIESSSPLKLAALAGLVAREGLNVRTIHALHANQSPDRVALTDTRSSLTYEELDRAINRTAAALSRVAKGAPVILCSENRVDYVVFWFGCLRARLPVAHASPRSTPDELAYLLENSGARTIVCSGKTAPAVVAVAGDATVVCVDRVDGADHLHPDWTVDEPETPFISDRRGSGADNIVYTSGTTGRPKGAVRDFARQGLPELARIGERFPMRVGERHLVVCPLYHSAAQALVAMMTSLGATIRLAEKFDARETVETMASWNANSVFLVPTMIQRIAELDDAVFEAAPMDDLRAILSGAAPFPDALRRKAIRRFGAERIFDFYGATELGWITLIRGDEMLTHPGSVGRALDGHELAIFDAAGHEVTDGGIGTIHCRTAQTMQGYLRNEGEGADVDGWITVDDLGRIDADGYLYLAGRDRDMVISGGMNIYPVEIEEALRHHADVDDIAVVGIPDEEWGERLVAFVVGAAGADELETFGRQKLAPYKVPRQWVFLDELPRNATGKVLKRDLRASVS